MVYRQIFFHDGMSIIAGEFSRGSMFLELDTSLLIVSAQQFFGHL